VLIFCFHIFPVERWNKPAPALQLLISVNQAGVRFSDLFYDLIFSNLPTSAKIVFLVQSSKYIGRHHWLQMRNVQLLRGYYLTQSCIKRDLSLNQAAYFLTQRLAIWHEADCE
jgi:hypothetical protein